MPGTRPPAPGRDVVVDHDDADVSYDDDVSYNEEDVDDDDDAPDTSAHDVPLRAGPDDLRSVFADFIEDCPRAANGPVAAAVYDLLDVAPRSARHCVPLLWSLPEGIAFVHLGDLHPRPSPGLRAALRRWQAAPVSSTSLPVTSPRDLIARLQATSGAPVLTRPMAAAFHQHFGQASRHRQSVLEALRGDDAVAADEALLVAITALRIAEARDRPPAWPILVDDDVPHAAARRALLERLRPLRGPRAMIFSWHVQHFSLEEHSLSLSLLKRGTWQPEYVTVDVRGLTATARSAEARAAAFALLFDIINEPTATEGPMVTSWVEPPTAKILAALEALVAERAPTEDAVDVRPERLVWEVDVEDFVDVWLVPRRQKPKVKGGYGKGVVVKAEGLIHTDDPACSLQDKRLAMAVAWEDPRRALLHLHGPQQGQVRVVDRRGDDVQVIVEPVRVALRDEDDGQIAVQFWLGDTEIPAQTILAPVVACWAPPPLLATSTRVLQVGEVSERLERLAETVAVRNSAGGIRLPPEARPVLEKLADRVVRDGLGASVHLADSLVGEAVPSTPTLAVRLHLSDPLHLEAVVSVLPGEGTGFYAPARGGPEALGLKDGQRVRYRRDHDAERALAAPILEALAEVATPQDAGDHIFVGVGEDALALLERTQALSAAHGFELVWRDRRLQLAAPVQASGLKLKLSKTKQWLGLDGDVEVNGQRVQLAALLAAVRDRRRYVAVGTDTHVGLSADLREALRGLANLVDDEPGKAGFEVSIAAAPSLDALAQAGAAFEEGAVWATMRERLQRARDVDDVVPSGLQAELRPYQREGVMFLRRLAAFGTGGVLADDMGLGKTLQAIGLLLDRKPLGPAVVVAPTSLIFNWQRELERFAPAVGGGLRVHVYGEASDREATIAAMRSGDVLLVSYGLVDERFVDAAFATAIFDEAQALKNAETQRARACRDLGAALKIGLTGTPLENHLGELWSLFRVVCPGLFGSQEQFRKRYLIPIERDRSVAHRRQLGQSVRPFLLRRTKAEVLEDLPPLTEQLLEIEPTAAERAIYDALRVEILEDLHGDGASGDVSENGGQDRRFKVLAGLTRLRLCCCHPSLVEPAFVEEGSKLAAAVATLVQVRDTGHKALVFSQFVKFMDLLEPALLAAGLKVLRLDGSTPPAQRRERVDAFQRGEADVFVLSLKAGGAGLNLTAADVVVHLDPWWNPAVEAQAMARAHRMGRQAPVTAIRMAVRDTIEAAILKLHDEKRELIDGVLAGASGGGSLGLEDIAQLLR